jgi:hypothetical protein
MLKWHAECLYSGRLAKLEFTGVYLSIFVCIMQTGGLYLCFQEIIAVNLHWRHSNTKLKFVKDKSRKGNIQAIFCFHLIISHLQVHIDIQYAEEKPSSTI